MMTNVKAFGYAAAMTLAAAGAAMAHHSTAMFDFNNEITLTGTVIEFQYTNPHSWLIMEVKNEDGTTTEWGFEADGPGVLMRRGISPRSVEPGMEVTMRAAPMKDGRPAGSWLEATLPDGSTLRP